jgi:regulatory protein
MSSPGNLREPRAPRRAKARPSLKMQAIGFLSRREHSRQELRAKLLDALRKPVREDAALSAAAGKAALDLARALDAQSSNGIDDAFAPTAPPVRAMAAASSAPSSPVDDLQATDPEAAVDQLLDWLTANKYLDETRFVESRVNARSRKQGTLRIKMELSRHGLALEPEQAAALRESEFARAQALWQRKFGAVAADARERAKQARFLAARGFAADLVRRIVGGLEES